MLPIAMATGVVMTVHRATCFSVLIEKEEKNLFMAYKKYPSHCVTQNDIVN